MFIRFWTLWNNNTYVETSLIFEGFHTFPKIHFNFIVIIVMGLWEWTQFLIETLTSSNCALHHLMVVLIFPYIVITDAGFIEIWQITSLGGDEIHHLHPPLNLRCPKSGAFYYPTPIFITFFMIFLFAAFQKKKIKLRLVL